VHSVGYNKYVDIINLKLKENHKVITFDIKELLVNIRIEETLVITRSLLMQNNDTQSAPQTVNLMKLTLSQNYFLFLNKIYQPKKGVDVRSPISNLICEIFLQFLED